MKNIDNFNNLKKIAITANKIKSIYTYKNSSSISFLDLSLNKLQNLSGIESYSNLTNFDFNDNYIKNLKPLNNLTKLISLNLRTWVYNEPINLDKKMLDFKFGYPYHNYERSI